MQARKLIQTQIVLVGANKSSCPSHKIETLERHGATVSEKSQPCFISMIKDTTLPLFKMLPYVADNMIKPGLIAQLYSQSR